MRSTAIINSILLFTAATTAWPWPSSWRPQGEVRRDTTLEARRAQDVYRRQQSSFDLSFTGEQGNTATTKTTQKTTKGDASASASASPTKDSDNTKSGDNSKTTGKTTGKNGDDDNGKKTTSKSKYETTKTYDNRLPAGGVSMITPALIAGPQYYKIASEPSKNYVTFAWNYTSLSATPSRIDILASCSLNSATYTIAANATVTPGSGMQAVTWDTGAYQATATQPLLMATYTLIIMEADSEITAMPRSGYLGTWSQFTFGMYIPQPYKKMANYVCATCSGASSMTSHTMGFMFGMAALTVLSFGWFGGVAGLW